MTLRFRVCLVVIATGLFLQLAPTVSGNPSGEIHIAMQQSTQSQGQSPSTSPSDLNRTTQTEPGSGATTANDYNTSSFSWGSFLGGLALGAILGYVLARRPGSTVPIQRDRAA